jgi:hypothetical protein
MQILKKQPTPLAPAPCPLAYTTTSHSTTGAVLQLIFFKWSFFDDFWWKNVIFIENWIFFNGFQNRKTL